MMRLLRGIAMAAALLSMSTLALGRSTVDYTTEGTDSDMDLPSSEYKYRVNGTQLLNTDVTNMRLSPLSAKYYSISREEFSSSMILYGHLQVVNSTNYTSFPANTIPYLSCDNPEATDIIESFFDPSATNRNIVVVILYSQRHQYCNISDSLAVTVDVSFFSIGTPAEANALRMLSLSDSRSGTVTIGPDVVSLPPENPDYSRRRNSPIPMIVLYALTSTITVLLLVVIVGGAIKARRHPERYGPRTILRPRQSRARGIAMAMLETLPIVKFGDSELNKDKADPHDGDVELAGNTKGSEPTADGAKVVAPVGNESKPGDQTTAAKSSESAEQVSTPHPELSISVDKPKDDSGLSPQNPTNPRSSTVAESLICSICTEDFVVGEELRVLPCDHRFHPACVDPWLLNVSGTCPLCRIDLRPPQDILAEENNLPFRITPAGPRLSTNRPMSSDDAGPSTVQTTGLERIAGASREERIGILRRWREERRRSQQPSREHDAREGEGNETSVPDRRRSKRFSQFLRTMSYQEDSHASGASSRSDRPSSLAMASPEAPPTAPATNTVPQPSPLGRQSSSTTTPDGGERAS